MVKRYDIPGWTLALVMTAGFALTLI